MVISKKLEYVFVNVPKCASQTLRYVLCTEYAGEQLRGAHHHRTDAPSWAQAYYSFAVVRNPYDRAISLWWAMVKERHDDRYGLRGRCGSTELVPFLQWLVGVEPYDPILFGQAAWLANVRLNRVLRFETLDDDVQQLPFWARTELLPRRNAFQRPHWSTFVDGEVADLIEQWASADFAVYGYSREVPACT